MGRRQRRGQRRRQSGNELCVYCGDQPATTTDHVFPRLLFIKRDPQMVTVPACTSCQIVKERGDIDLRDFVNIDYVGARHPDAKHQQTKIIRATARGQSRFGQAARDRRRPIALTTPSGLYVDWLYRIPINSDALMTTVRMIIRGLYYEETKTPLPRQADVEVRYIESGEVPHLVALLPAMRPSNIVMKGNRTAGWAVFRDNAEPYVSIWLLEFNDRVFFVGIIDDPPSDAANPEVA